MRLSDHLEPRFVHLDMRARGMEDAIAELVEHLQAAESGLDRAAVERALVEREASHTTSLGNGVALPHATVPGVRRPMLIVGVAPEGVEFAPGEDEPVRLFFLLLSPVDQAGIHIKLLARIVRLVRQPGFPAALIDASDSRALLEEIERVDALHV